MSNRVAQALWYTGPERVEIRDEELLTPTSDQVRIHALYSGISRGTERLVFLGRVPPSEFDRMRAPFMAGEFPFPVKYGYAMVGRVEAAPTEWRDRIVFALHPHQTTFLLPLSAVTPLPASVPPRRAVLAANMETALNAVWDAAPAPADRIAVIGGGVVGALIAYLCGQLPGARVTLVDIEPSRAALANGLSVAFAAPATAPRDCDLVFHASGTAAGLATAIEIAGDEATIAEVSWHGAGEVAVALGGAFHSRRLRLISSQVGRVATSHRPRWTHARRLAAALDLLADDRLDALLAPPIRFRDLAARLPEVLGPASGGLCHPVTYSNVVN